MRNTEPKGSALADQNGWRDSSGMFLCVAGYASDGLRKYVFCISQYLLSELFIFKTKHILAAQD